MTLSIYWLNIIVIAVVALIAAAIGVFIGHYIQARRVARRQRRDAFGPAPRHSTKLDLPAPPERGAQEPVSFEDHATQAVRTVRKSRVDRRVIAGCHAPTIDGVTFRDYLMYHSTRKCPHLSAETGQSEHIGVWPCVVEDVYTAALDSHLASYFAARVERKGGMADLKRHMLSTLVTVTHVGLTVDTADRLQDAHAELGITQADYTTVIDVLVASIGNYASPAVMKHVLPQLTPMVTELKSRIVTA